MSVENTVGRIVEALESIASSLEKLANPLMSVAAPVATGTTAPAFDGVLATPVPPTVAPVTEAFEMPTDGEGLKTMAQNIASKLGDNIPAFTAWVRDVLCPKYGVKKVANIPLQSIGEAAREMVRISKTYGTAV